MAISAQAKSQLPVPKPLGKFNLSKLSDEELARCINDFEYYNETIALHTYLLQFLPRMDQLRTECQVLLDISKRKKCDIEELHLRVMESREILNKTYKEFKELQRLHQEYVTQTEESNPQLVLKKAMQEHEGKMKELRDSLAHCDNFSKTLQELYEETQRFYYDEALLKVTPRIQSEAVI